MELSYASTVRPVYVAVDKARQSPGYCSIGNREGNIQPRPAVRDSLKGSQVEVILPVRHLQCFQ